MTHPKKAPPVIGIVGGVGSGKSSVAAQFAKLGCAVVDADRIGHLLLRQPEIRRAVRRQLGKIVMTRTGYVNRRRLAAEVFSDPRKLDALNSIVHPELCTQFRGALEKARRRSGVRAVVLDAALLLEKGLDRLCDLVVYLHVPEEVRRARAATARGWGPSEVICREATQISLKVKRERADCIIDNSSSREHSFEQVRTVLSRLVKERSGA